VTEAVENKVGAEGGKLMGRKTPKKEIGKASQKGDILAEIDPETALEILRRLAEDNTDLKDKIKQTALEIMKGVDVEEVASDIFSCLDSLCVEDVWDNSGSTSYGYIEPTECALEMFETELEPFLEEMRRYQKLSMYDEARNYCMGILLGIHKFLSEATTEFADWSVDAPYDFFTRVLDEWNSKCKRNEDIETVNSFAREKFNKWWKDYHQDENG
jgi:hypothetical protein